ncbi:hypothetical protein MKEN_01055300 [Mycena kentingensis (nom. inval.)]|nr:hypothetical protein MKEN_01055300 [Mycena kentingensis (nom. inval.)]
MFVNKSALFAVAALVSGVVAAPLTSTPGGASNNISPVDACTADALKVPVDNLVEFAQIITNPNRLFPDNLFFFDQGKKVFPGIQDALADAQDAVAANDLQTVATKIQFVLDQVNTIPADFQDGNVTPEDLNLVAISSDITTACASFL